MRGARSYDRPVDLAALVYHRGSVAPRASRTPSNRIGHHACRYSSSAIYSIRRHFLHSRAKRGGGFSQHISSRGKYFPAKFPREIRAGRQKQCAEMESRVEENISFETFRSVRQKWTNDRANLRFGEYEIAVSYTAAVFRSPVRRSRRG